MFINSNLILLQLMLRISLTLQVRPASSADCQPVQLTSEDSNHPAQHVYSRRRLQSVSQGKTTPEDPQSNPVASLLVASSDSGSLFQVRRSSQVSYLVFFFLSYLMSPKHRAYLMSVQSSHEPEFFAEAFTSIILAGEMLCRKKSMPRKKKEIDFFFSLPAGKEDIGCKWIYQDQA